MNGSLVCVLPTLTGVAHILSSQIRVQTSSSSCSSKKERKKGRSEVYARVFTRAFLWPFCIGQTYNSVSPSVWVDPDKVMGSRIVLHAIEP